MLTVETKPTFFEVFVSIVLVLSVLATIVFISVSLGNETNRITEGVIVDKRIVPGRAQGNASNKNFIHYQAHDTIYNFCLSGSKNGKDVTYWVTVSEEDYTQYKIGDYYSV